VYIYIHVRQSMSSSNSVDSVHMFVRRLRACCHCTALLAAEIVHLYLCTL
jgi:hypothetical protein